MKKLLLICIGIIVCSVSTDAQNLLDRLGKTVQKKVTEKVTESVKKKVRDAVSGKGNDRKSQAAGQGTV